MNTKNPYVVLAAALALPGSGHVMLGLPQRGLVFLFFIIVLGMATNHVMPEGSSFIAGNIGGIFIYGLSVIDAYKIARVRFEVARHEDKNPL